MSSRAKGVSIIICSYNGEKRIAETIRHIAKQEVEDNIKWEVIFVDNSSTDNVLNEARKVWELLGANKVLRILEEPRAGKNFALEKGIDAANYEYMLVCDDDNWLSPKYVSTCFKVMEENTDVALIGGHGEAAFEKTPPDWFTKYKGCYAVGPQANETGYISADRNFIYGAGSVIRYSAWRNVKDAGFKALLAGPAGGRLNGGGEDVELCYAFLIAGYHLWYDKSMIFQHFMPADRLTLDYLTRMISNTANLFDVTFAYEVVMSGERKNKNKSDDFNMLIRQEIKRSLTAWSKELLRLFKNNIIGKENLHEGRIQVIRNYIKFKICVFSYNKIKKNIVHINKFTKNITINQ